MFINNQYIIWIWYNKKHDEHVLLIHSDKFPYLLPLFHSFSQKGISHWGKLYYIISYRKKKWWRHTETFPIIHREKVEFEKKNLIIWLFNAKKSETNINITLKWSSWNYYLLFGLGLSEIDPRILWNRLTGWTWSYF